MLASTVVLLSAGLAGCNTASTLNPSEIMTEGYVVDKEALESIDGDGHSILYSNL